MKTVIMVNGAYGPLEAYRDIAAAADALLAVDGGANAAHKLQLRPDLLLGDELRCAAMGLNNLVQFLPLHGLPP